MRARMTSGAPWCRGDPVIFTQKRARATPVSCASHARCPEHLFSSAFWVAGGRCHSPDAARRNGRRAGDVRKVLVSHCKAASVRIGGSKALARRGRPGCTRRAKKARPFRGSPPKTSSICGPPSAPHELGTTLVSPPPRELQHAKRSGSSSPVVLVPPRCKLAARPLRGRLACARPCRLAPHYAIAVALHQRH